MITSATSANGLKTLVYVSLSLVTVGSGYFAEQRDTDLA
jgi:hypothetical protein